MYEVYFYIKEYHDNIRLCVHEQTFGACFDTIDEIRTWARENISFPDRITKIIDLRTAEEISLTAIE